MNTKITTNTAILFRRPTVDPYSTVGDEEIAAAKKYFPLHMIREEIEPNSLVVGRYSVLPYYLEQEQGLHRTACRLINTYKQHRWIADFDYYETVKQWTPKTWLDPADNPEFSQSTCPGPFIVRGVTNSRKHQWNTHMYAMDRTEAFSVLSRLFNDTLIGRQKLIIREYVPLRTLEIGINGMPFSNEYRFFFLGNKLLASGFYWTTAERADEINAKGVPVEATQLARSIARTVSKHVEFFVLDIAETRVGKWILIEINDGQMSGTAMCSFDKLYGNLRKFI